MEPQQNTGSFMAPVAPNAADPIMEALARRGANASPTTAQSSISQTPTPGAIPNSNPAPPSGLQTGVSAQGGVGAPPQPRESELIIRALSQRLSSISKLETQGV